MEEQHINEAVRIATEVSNGNWIPAAVVGSLFTVIILLLLYIYNRDRKASEQRHSDNEETQRKLTDSNEKLTILVNRHDVEIQNLKNGEK